MAEKLFRKVAIERQASPEQLDVLMQVTSPKLWLSLLALATLVLSALVWGFVGYVPVKVTGQGMLMRMGGVYEVLASEAGELRALYFEPGEIVEKGNTVARLDQPELLKRVREAAAALSELRAQKELRGGAAAGLQGQRALEERISQAALSLELLQGDYEAASKVTSPFTGRVLELTVRIGELVAKGSPVLKMDLGGGESGGLQAVMYFPAGSGEKIRRGMAAQIAPLLVERSEYGYLMGLVTRVADYPSSHRGMMRMLQNETLVQSLSRDGPPIEVYVDLVPDPTAASGYKWSSSKGPELDLQTGTICSASVTVSKLRPIGLLVPLLKKRPAGNG